MPPDFGSPVAGRNTPPDGMTQLGNIMNLQRTQQALQSGALQIQQATAMNPLLQRAQQATTNVAERTQQPSIDTATANAANAQALAGQNQQALANQKMAGIASRYAGAINDPMIMAAEKNPDSVNKEALGSTIQKWGYQQAADLGIPREAADNIIAPYMDMAQNNPGGVRQFMKERLLSMLDHSSQASAINPSGIAVQNGQTSSTVSTNEFGPQAPGQVIPGTLQQAQLSPTTPVFNQDKNAMGYLGPQPSQGPPAYSNPNPESVRQEQMRIIQAEYDKETNPSAKAAMGRELSRLGATQGSPQVGSPVKSASLQSAPALGQGASSEGTSAVINQHWGKLSASASSAPQDIGVLQNIISHAKGAAVGVTGEREALLAGLAGRLGMTPAEMTKTDTDLLAKNSSMLALAGGDTNLAKTLAGVANPNSHMTESAIRQAAYQVMGQRQMDVASQKLFQPLKTLSDHGSPEAYNQVMQKFNGAADPRILQLQYMTPEEKAKMKHSMSPGEQKKFRADIGTLESLGVVSKQ